MMEVRNFIIYQIVQKHGSNLLSAPMVLKQSTCCSLSFAASGSGYRRVLFSYDLIIRAGVLSMAALLPLVLPRQR